MPRSLLILLVGVALIVSGCMSAPTPATRTPTPVPTTESPTPDSESPTPTPTTSVEYRLSVGTLPAEFRSVNATIRVVFVENEGDFAACWRDTYHGPYKPTVTPIAPPTGDCHRTTPVTLDLQSVTGERSLGPASAPARFDAGHGLVISNVSATYQNGTTVTGLRGTGGHVANVVRGDPSGPYGVTLAIESYQDRPYSYWLVSDVTTAG